MTSLPHYQTPTKASVANRIRADVAHVETPLLSSRPKQSLLISQASKKPKSQTTTAPMLHPTPQLSSMTKGSTTEHSPWAYRYTTETQLNSKASRSRWNDSITRSTRTTTTTTTPKCLYLIRHGQSQGQVASKLGMNRQRDQRLLDARLTKEGIRQAQQLTQYDFHHGPPELIVSSPLTRALHTALLGFPDAPQRILVHYDLAEVGGRAPENTPRPMRQVMKDLETTDHAVDAQTLLPKDGTLWPTVMYDGKNNRGKAIRRAMQYLYDERDEEIIAVVCHFNVIRQIMQGDDDKGAVIPRNAVPIHCILHANGKVEQITNDDDTIDKTRKVLNYC